MSEGSVASAAASQGYYRSAVASIPSRRSLNVQLGPTAPAGNDEAQLESQQPTVGWTSLEPLAATQRSPRRRPSNQPQQQQQHQQRLRWSRMTTAAPATSETTPMLSLESAAAAASAAASSSSSAGLCQLVDFGETRDLIRRHREAAKRLAEVNSIVSHLSLEKENCQEPREFIGWATFRRQPNSQFKQYVFQSPGQAPHPPETAPAQTRPQQPLQRSRTTLGLVAGRTAARHSRPEPLGASFRRELTAAASASAGADSSREASSLAAVASRHRPGGLLTQYRGQGHSSNAAFLTDTDDFYGKFERRKLSNGRVA